MSGPIQKLQLLHETHVPNVFTDVGKFTALFNPQTLQFKHAADWNVTSISGQIAAQQRHVFDFKATRPIELSLELFFDFSKEKGSDMKMTQEWETKLRAQHFKERLNTFVQLIRVNPELHRPPRCKLIWGTWVLMHGMLTALDRKYTAFSSEGMPIRAEFACRFTQVETEAEQKRSELHSADVAKRRVLRRGDTLQSLAREEYGDAALWRPIARANRITHPLKLTPGMSLLIPPLV
ncbi:hypothetical protein [Archangium primigenium]|uniref:CIS tube protein n=1 Tax=[Archangium] primigenium TaxID=2792470 RepID=UPI00195ACB1C|nr:hypothetical protein [Archangium primigenium]MBM7116692.1 hypothetical protein [Archangium primigenium]